MLQKISKNPKVQKFISSIIISAMIVPLFFITTPPKPVEAQWPTVDIKQLAKDIWANIQMAIARKIINTITSRVVTYINSGFSGNPFHLTNPEPFFKDIVKFEVRNLVDIYAYNKAKFPFGKQFALDTIETYQRQLEDNTAYSLSKVISDPVYLESYRNDFDVGGWDGFFINTQYAQNNDPGFRRIAYEDLDRKLSGTATTAAKTVQDTLQKSAGFLAPQRCDSNPEYNKITKNLFLRPSFDSADWQKKNPVSVCGTWSSSNTPQTNADIAACVEGWNRRFEAAKAGFKEKNDCPGGLTTTTPGSILGSQIAESLQSKGRQAELAAAIGNSLGLIFDTLLAKLYEKGKGLLDQSGPEKDPTGVQSPPNETGYVGGGATVCTDIDIANDDGTGKGGGTACNTINPPSGSFPLYPGTTGGSGGGSGGGGGGGNTGGNTKCINAEGVATYEPYVSAVSVAEGVAYPNGLPSGTTGATAQAAVCGAYKGEGSCRAGAQEDELIITGLPSPYVTMSIDFLAGGYPYASTALYSRGVAACEAGVQ